MRYLSLDVGSKKIGIAIGETLAAELTTVNCLKNTTFYESRGYKDFLIKIKKLIDLEEADGLVVGLPVNKEGQPTEESQKIKSFTEKLKSDLGLTIHFVDETFTSYMAEEMLAAQDLNQGEVDKRVHQAAAQLILQQYLEDNE